MKELGIWEPLSVKLQTYKTAVEVSISHLSNLISSCTKEQIPYLCLCLQTAILLLRIDDIVSGSKKKKDDAGGAAPMPSEEAMKE